MKMIILGAGATAHSYHANPDRKPPLSNAEEFLRMFKEPTITRPTIQNHYLPFFTEAIKLYDGDIEALFTGLYMLEYHTLFNENELSCDTLKELQQLCSKTGNTNNTVTYANILTIFSGALVDEIRSCIGSSGKLPIMPPEMPVCRWHRLLSHTLNGGDVVVNFNYDPIMSYALLNEKKLSDKSFINSHIKKVDIQSNLLADDPIILLNPHGSFTWYQDVSLGNYWDGKQFSHTKELVEVMNTVRTYQDRNQEIPEDLVIALNRKLHPVIITVGLNRCPPSGNYGLHPLILPLKKKSAIFSCFPQFEEEYKSFLNKLSEVNEVCVIGKQFESTDQDIAADIKRVCQQGRKKKIVYVNPAATNTDTNTEWLKYHNNIFNAESPVCFKSLEEYATHISSKLAVLG